MSSETLADLVDLEHRYIMGTFKRLPITMVEGRGATVRDSEGREYLDLVAGIAVNVLGHAHPAVARAVAEQAGRLIHTSNLYYTEPQVALAKKLVELSFPSRVFFANSGAEANEAAIKVARKWGKVRRDGAFEIVTTNDAFHGRTLTTVTARGKDAYSAPFGPLPPGFVHVPYGDLDAIKGATGERTVAVILEPILGEAGVEPPPAGLRGRRGGAERDRGGGPGRPRGRDGRAPAVGARRAGRRPPGPGPRVDAGGGVRAAGGARVPDPLPGRGRDRQRDRRLDR